MFGHPFANPFGTRFFDDDWFDAPMYDPFGYYTTRPTTTARRFGKRQPQARRQQPEQQQQQREQQQEQQREQLKSQSEHQQPAKTTSTEEKASSEKEKAAAAEHRRSRRLRRRPFGYVNPHAWAWGPAFASDSESDEDVLMREAAAAPMRSALHALDHMLDPRLGLGVLLFNNKEAAAAAAADKSAANKALTTPTTTTTATTTDANKGDATEQKHDTIATTSSAASTAMADASSASSACGSCMVDSTGNTFALSDWTAPLRIKCDVVETEKNFEVRCDVPGMDKKDLKVSVTRDGVLTIRGERHRDHEHERCADKEDEKEKPADKEAEKKEKKSGNNWRRVERSYGFVQRSFQLPTNANLNNITSRHDKGVLTIDIPKTADKPATGDIVIQ